MNPVAAFLVLAGGGLLLAGLVRFFVRRQRVARLQRWDDEGVSVRAISARLVEEESHEQLAVANTEILPALPVDDVPTEVFPAVAALPPLPCRKRPYVEQQPTPWKRHAAVSSPDPVLMRRVLEGLRRLT
ncbi:hypothetical protein [Amycolatopsis sp. H20-H5]|uniref:hypothetical protein n=1 Tax=Amycolatopsis sp. H20-H5 TaxID=3046309 RepID=UPI002DBDA9FF|nr:hypothetical protein [Amycolatopsis sp. H20-H5]MEC3980413.1 hypothetical protein [Amycolatopsis sp. H20-H5]